MVSVRLSACTGKINYHCENQLPYIYIYTEGALAFTWVCVCVTEGALVIEGALAFTWESHKKKFLGLLDVFSF